MGNHVELNDKKPRTLFIARSSNYAKNCASGFQGDYHNAHHVIPCTSINNSLYTYLDKKPVAYNKALARFTKWDVNAEYNLVGLPHKHAYELHFKDVTRADLAGLAPQWMMKAVALPGLVKYPIHLPTSWGHVDYNKLVEEELDAIWDSLSVEVKKHEPIKADDMGQMIKNVGTAFRDLLVAKVAQTKADWQVDQKSPEFMMI